MSRLGPAEALQGYFVACTRRTFTSCVVHRNIHAACLLLSTCRLRRVPLPCWSKECTRANGASAAEARRTLRQGSKSVKAACMQFATAVDVDMRGNAAVCGSKPERTITCCVGVARSSKMQVPVVSRHSEALPQPGLIFWLQDVAQRR